MKRRTVQGEELAEIAGRRKQREAMQLLRQKKKEQRRVGRRNRAKVRKIVARLDAEREIQSDAERIAAEIAALWAES